MLDFSVAFACFLTKKNRMQIISSVDLRAHCREGIFFVQETAMMIGFCSSKNLTTMDIKSNYKLFVLLGFKTTSPAPTQQHKRLCVRGLWEDQGKRLSWGCCGIEREKKAIVSHE